MIDWTLAAWAWLGSAALMGILWLVQLRTRNAAIVDVGWAASLGLIAVGYGLGAGGGAVHRALIAAVAGSWGLRLAWHLLRDRVQNAPEEGRYAALRARWGDRADAWLLAFFQAQALLAAGLSLPMLAVASRVSESLVVGEIIGVVLVGIGVVGESIADRQLSRFKRRPGTDGQVCREGLWKVSRHPNYFFEWLVWCGYAVMAWGAPGGWTGLVAAAVMLVLILKVTGIPPTEAQALRSRGAAYRAYQETVSPFVPWPTRRALS